MRKFDLYLIQRWTFGFLDVRLTQRSSCESYSSLVSFPDSSLVRSGVAFDRWPTHRYIRSLRRAFQVKELQARHRIFALLRRDQGHERVLVLPHLFALPLLAVTTVVGSWISAEAPFRLSSKIFVAQHVHWCSGVNHEFSFLWSFRSGRRRCPGFNRRVKRSFIDFLSL